MLPGILPDVHLIFGVYPIAPLIIAATVWLLYRVLLYLKVLPKHGIVFLMVGATCAFVSFFCELARPLLLAQYYCTDGEATWTLYKRVYTISIANDRVFRLQEMYCAAGEWAGIQPIYLFNITLLLLIIVVQLMRMRQIRKQAHLAKRYKDVHIYQTGLPSPFSFGKNVFLPGRLDPKHQPYILAHEMSHVKHHHFNELLFLRLMLCTQWYNPFFWIILYEIKLLQEFEADKDAMAFHTNRKDYQLCLVEMASDRKNLFSFRHHFAEPSLKKRIIFMNRNVLLNTSRKRVLITIAAVLATALTAISCQPDIKTEDTAEASEPRHPLYGTWIRKNAVCENEQRLDINMQYYKIIRNDRALLVDIIHIDPETKNISLKARTMHFSYVCDTLIQENGIDTKIRVIDDNHFSLSWYQHGFSPKGEPVTRKILELWERHELPAVFKEFLQTEFPPKRWLKWQDAKPN